MPSLLAKGLIIILGATSVSGCAALVSKALSPEVPITSLLAEDAKTLLTSSDSEDSWKSKWQSFIEAHYDNKTPSGAWSIREWESNKSNRGAVPNEFKNNCRINGEKKVLNREDPLYKDVYTYCTK